MQFNVFKINFLIKREWDRKEFRLCTYCETMGSVSEANALVPDSTLMSPREPCQLQELLEKPCKRLIRLVRFLCLACPISGLAWPTAASVVGWGVWVHGDKTWHQRLWPCGDLPLHHVECPGNPSGLGRDGLASSASCDLISPHPGLLGR